MNSFGRIFRIHIFGESHGEKIGVSIDGCPAGIPLQAGDFEKDLARRRSGAKGTTARKEADLPMLISGVYKGYTSGSPIVVLFDNADVRSSDYSVFNEIPRPGHADFTATKKWKGFNDLRGSGHLSGRITLGMVAAGVLAKKITAPVEIQANILSVGGTTDWDAELEKVIAEGDSLGAIVECRARHIPAGLGEPFFDSLESLISHLIFAVPAVKAIEFGAGFEAARMKGSQHNDVYIPADAGFSDEQGKTATNHAGGINGGISNGNELVFRIAVKPTSSIGIPQKTMNMKTGTMTELHIAGRHDACIALRMPVIAEAATAIVLADLLLLHKAMSL